MEKSVTVAGRKSATGEADLRVESAGWYIQIGNLSLFTGDMEPPFKKGDSVRIILEKERNDADEEAKS
jgi:hypothetical protein